MIGAAEEIRYRVPDAPTIGGSLRAAASDFYFNSWRLVPFNVIWGVLFLGMLVFALWWWPLLALLCLLALPVAGMFRMATLIQRGANISFSDGVTGMRSFARPALLVGVATILVITVLISNVALGISGGGVVGGVFAVLAGYAVLGLAMYLLAAWPILVDPVREELSLAQRLRLAFLVVVSRPGRMLALTLVIALVLLLSTILFAALLTISIAYIALVATHYVLPAADRLEGRATVALPS